MYCKPVTKENCFSNVFFTDCSVYWSSQTCSGFRWVSEVTSCGRNVREATLLSLSSFKGKYIFRNHVLVCNQPKTIKEALRACASV